VIKTDHKTITNLSEIITLCSYAVLAVDCYKESKTMSSRMTRVIGKWSELQLKLAVK